MKEFAVVFGLILATFVASQTAVAQQNPTSKASSNTQVSAPPASIESAPIEKEKNGEDDASARKVATPQETITAPVSGKVPAAAPPQACATTAGSDYKTNLNGLATLYQNEVTRLEKQNSTSKDLFKDGLISRVEMEKSDKALADAKTRVEEIAKQIADANKPVPVTSMALTTTGLNDSWSTGNARIDSLIRYYGSQHGVDPFLIFCLMSQESKFTSGAISPKGARGLMQLMPGTAARYGVTNPYDVAQSISGGTRYLKDLLKMFDGRIDLALAGYNAGEGAVIKYGYNIPPYDETRNYVKLIIKRYGRVTSAAPANKAEEKTDKGS